MARALFRATTFIALLVAASPGLSALAADSESGCVFGNGAIPAPSIPKALVFAQKFTAVAEGRAIYSAILTNGLVILSTHMACEHYGAEILLNIPSDRFDRANGGGEQVKDLLTWYMGKKNADQVLSKIKGQKLIEGFSKQIANASEEFPNVSISIRSQSVTYVTIEVYYFSDLG